MIGQRKDNAYTVSAKFTPGNKFDYELGYQTMNADHAAVNGGGFVLNAYANASNATMSATGKRKNPIWIDVLSLRQAYRTVSGT
ncbi:hypothetical protein ACFS07_01590 [Undibacterium arcticum]